MTDKILRPLPATDRDTLPFWTGGKDGRLLIERCNDCHYLIHPPTGCPFHPRCRFAEDKCRRERPPLAEIEPGRRAACWFPFIDATSATGEAIRSSETLDG